MKEFHIEAPTQKKLQILRFRKQHTAYEQIVNKNKRNYMVVAKLKRS